MSRLATLLIVSGMWVGVVGCGGDDVDTTDKSSRPLAVTPLLASETCTGDIKETSEKVEILKDAAAYMLAFSRSTQGGAQPSVVDFSNAYVVSAHMGRQTDCGSSISITAARETDAVVEVEVTYTTRPGCDADSALSYPFAFATVPRSSKPYKIIQKRVSMVCK